MRLSWPYNKYYFNAEIWIRNKLFYFMLWRTAQELYLSCWLWKLRGLERCNKHGFYAQSWLNGKCNKCHKEDATLSLLFVGKMLNITIDMSKKILSKRKDI